ncbi:MAG TPA: 5-formyltetrahydrofolate cyclo-ligase [Dermatophilaceae bacterium]|nr:5-formyltetrahydrofolate cyclo-ligase [Dermatophilaceae bacterium]
MNTMQPYAGEPAPSAKAQLRAWLRQQRRERVPLRDSAEDSAGIVRWAREALVAMGIGSGSTVAAYESLPTEPPTQALLHALTADGIRVLVPLTLADWTLDWVDAHDPERVPLGAEALREADLVFVPALAVDLGGARLGKGRACYDRALLLARQGVRRVAVVHPWELLTEPIPVEDHDLRMDAAITAEGLVSLGRWSPARG